MRRIIFSSYSNSADSHFNLSSYASILARNSIFFNLYFCSKTINFRIVLRRLLSMLSASALIRGISQISFRPEGIDHNLSNRVSFIVIGCFHLQIAKFSLKNVSQIILQTTEPIVL